MKILTTLCLLSGLLFNTAHAYGEQMLMTRVNMSFPEAMLKLQERIQAQGYQLSRVQRVDIGLTSSGYTTDKYRLVFFGKLKENRELTAKYPMLYAYLPLKIAIFAEQEETLLVTYDPALLFSESDETLRQTTMRWKKDLEAIFNTMQN